MQDNFENLIDTIGSNGPWQTVTIIQSFLTQTFLAMPLYQQNYLLTGKMDYVCTTNIDTGPDSTQLKQVDANVSSSSQCWAHAAGENSERCTDWTYSSAYYKSTLVSEFDLICERSYLVPLYKSMFLVGFLIGVPIWGAFSDMFGRYPTIAITVPLQLLSAVVTLTSPYFAIICAVRVLSGMAYAGAMTTLFVLNMEIVRPTMRNGVAVFFGLSSPTAGALVSLVGIYVEREWRTAHMYASLAAALALPLSMLLFESPRWLIINKKFARAKRILARGAWMNSSEIPLDIDLRLQTLYNAHVGENPTQLRRPSLLPEEATFVEPANQPDEQTAKKVQQSDSGWNKLLLPFTERGLRRRTLALAASWFVVGMVFYGTTFYSTGQMNANPFITLLFTSVTRIIWAPVLIAIIDFSGKRRSLAAAYVSAGLSLVVLALLVRADAPSWQLTTIAIVAITSIHSALEILYIFTSELYPTLVRQSGLSICSMMARVGGIASPFVADSVALWWQPAPSIVFATLCFLAVLHMWTLPEMNKRSLPDSVRDTQAQKVLIKENLTDMYVKPEDVVDNVRDSRSTSPVRRAG